MSKEKIIVAEDLGIVSEDQKLPFPLLEYQNRLNKIRKEMESRGIDLLYLTMPESMYYVSGLNLNWYQLNSSPTWASSNANGIAVHVDHDKFILFQIPDEEHTVMGGTCCTDARFIADQPGVTDMLGRKLYTAELGKEIPMDLVVKNLKEEGWLKGRVAMEMGSPRPCWSVGQCLKEKFEKAGCKEVIDGTDVLLKIRGKKSPMEMNYIQKASNLADIAHKAIYNGVREGMTELELVAEYTGAMLRAGGESMAIVDQVGFGKGKLWWVHSQAGRKKLMVGDPIRIDLCGVYNRYHSNQGRTYSFGEPEKEVAEMYARNYKIMQKVKETIKTGMYVNDFFGQIIKFFKEEGIWGQQYWLGGYEIGIAFPPDWCGNFVYDAYVDAKDARFEAGMVVNFESGFGVVDTLMFTEDEAKILGHTPWELQIIDPDRARITG